MSLNWNIENCNLTEEEKKEHWDTIEAVIWSTILIDIGEITKDNLEKFEYRLRMWSRTSPLEIHKIIPFLPKLIGLRTNVATTTDKQFEKKLILSIDYDVKREIKLSRAGV